MGRVVGDIMEFEGLVAEAVFGFLEVRELFGPPAFCVWAWVCGRDHFLNCFNDDDHEFVAKENEVVV